MIFTEKFRFFIITPGYLRRIIEEKNHETVKYRILTDEHGIILQLGSQKKENIAGFMDFFPHEAMFFHLPCRIEYSIAELASRMLESENLKLCLVESCTGGLAGKIITDKPGSSKWFWGGFITYDNEAKIKLGVDRDIINKFGAVSAETVKRMAEKGLEKSGADICASISGIAGPEGGSLEKPVGTVWIGVTKGKSENAPEAYCFRFSGSRAEIREKAAQASLLVLCRTLSGRPGVDSNIFEYYI